MNVTKQLNSFIGSKNPEDGKIIGISNKYFLVEALRGDTVSIYAGDSKNYRVGDYIVFVRGRKPQVLGLSNNKHLFVKPIRFSL